MKETEKQCYDVLRSFGRFGDDAGATSEELQKRACAKHGRRHAEYWARILENLIDMGYAEKIGTRKRQGKTPVAVYAARDPWEDQ